MVKISFGCYANVTYLVVLRIMYYIAHKYYFMIATNNPVQASDNEKVINELQVKNGQENTEQTVLTGVIGDRDEWEMQVERLNKFIEAMNPVIDRINEICREFGFQDVANVFGFVVRENKWNLFIDQARF